MRSPNLYIVTLAFHLSIVHIGLQPTYLGYLKQYTGDDNALQIYNKQFDDINTLIVSSETITLASHIANFMVIQSGKPLFRVGAVVSSSRYPLSMGVYNAGPSDQ